MRRTVVQHLYRSGRAFEPGHMPTQLVVGGFNRQEPHLTARRHRHRPRIPPEAPSVQRACSRNSTAARFSSLTYASQRSASMSGDTMAAAAHGLITFQPAGFGLFCIIQLRKGPANSTGTTSNPPWLESPFLTPQASYESGIPASDG